MITSEQIIILEKLFAKDAHGDVLKAIRTDKDYKRVAEIF